MAPQWRVASPTRAAGNPSIRTDLLLAATSQVLDPQHEEWTPVSPRRNAGLLLIITVEDPLTAGPITVCGQAGQPWLSLCALALSPTRAIPGMGFLLGLVQCLQVFALALIERGVGSYLPAGRMESKMVSQTAIFASN
jgi:hypothetical protein